MAKWLHFSADSEKFTEGDTLKKIENEFPNGFADEGLYVYRYTPSSEDKLAAGWAGRRAIIVECDSAELVQENPLDDDSDFDEYVIPVERFDEAVVIYS